MPEPEAREAALSSALEIVQEVHGALDRLHSRLGSEVGTEAYRATLEEVRIFTDQMVKLLTIDPSRS